MVGSRVHLHNFVAGNDYGLVFLKAGVGIDV